MTDKQQQQVFDWVKVGAFPILLTVVGVFLYGIYTDMKLVSSLIYEVKIEQAITSSELRALNKSMEQIEKRVQRLEQQNKETK